MALVVVVVPKHLGKGVNDMLLLADAWQRGYHFQPAFDNQSGEVVLGSRQRYRLERSISHKLHVGGYQETEMCMYDIVNQS